jgi:hypothetical protein
MELHGAVRDCCARVRIWLARIREDENYEWG